MVSILSPVRTAFFNQTVVDYPVLRGMCWNALMHPEQPIKTPELKQLFPLVKGSGLIERMKAVVLRAMHSLLSLFPTYHRKYESAKNGIIEAVEKKVAAAQNRIPKMNFLAQRKRIHNEKLQRVDGLINQTEERLRIAVDQSSPEEVNYLTTGLNDLRERKEKLKSQGPDTLGKNRAFDKKFLSNEAHRRQLPYRVQAAFQGLKARKEFLALRHNHREKLEALVQLETSRNTALMAAQQRLDQLEEGRITCQIVTGYLTEQRNLINEALKNTSLS